MALGGGVFTTQNKLLPGSYINFIAANRGNPTLSERGYTALALELDWCKDDEVIEITNEDFQKDSLKILGYDYGHDKLKSLRDLFLNTKTLYLYKLNKGTKAENSYATAKYSGVRGNDLKIVVKTDVDEEETKQVYLYLDDKMVDFQKIKTANELKDNDFVEWKKSATINATSGMNLTGGTNGTVNVSNHQTFLSKIESYSFNVMGYNGDDSSIKKLYAAFTKRMRDEVGLKFQTVLYNFKGDFEGIINVKNSVDLVLWVTGAEAGCEVNRDLTNRKYDGDYEITTSYTQNELKEAIKNGEFVFHRVGKEFKVLEDINSLTTITEEKGDIFKQNQTMRVIDLIANDIATLFNTRYLGLVPNDKAGRVSLWNDIVKYHEQLEKIRAIENFDGKDIVVEQGDTKRAVLVQNKITVVNAMTHLYMIVKVA